MSGEGMKVPRREPAGGDATPRPEGPVSLGSAAPAGQKEFFLIEYVRELKRGVGWLRSSPKPEQSTLTRVQKGLLRWSKGSKSRIGVVVVIGIIAVSYMLFSAQAGSTPTLSGPGTPGGGGPGANNATITLTGTVAENGENAGTADLDGHTRVASLTVTLSWTDQPASNPTVRQTPDSLGFNVTAPNGDGWDAPAATNGRIVWSLDDTSVDFGGTAWTITVKGGAMGDEVPISGRPGPCLRCGADTSNSYTVTVEYTW